MAERSTEAGPERQNERQNTDELHTSELLPQLNHFFITAARHDRDRIELDFDFDGLVQSKNPKFTYDVDVVLFVPKSLGVGDVDSREQLRHEFQSYVRLHTHLSNPKIEMNLSRLKERLEALKTQYTRKSIHTFAVEFEAYLKAHMKALKKEAVRAPIDSPPLKQHFTAELQALQALMDDFRDVIQAKKISGLQSSDFPHDSLERDLLLMNEYVSHVYVQNLGELYRGAKRVHQDQLLPLIEKNCQSEAKIRATYHFLLSGMPDDACRFREDVYLRRVGSLKKYFHKALFVSIAGTNSEKKLRLPVYGLSAAMAAIWAVSLSIYQSTSPVPNQLGIGAITFITIGTLIYVSREIMKDYVRNYLFSKGQRWVPDFEKKLYIERFAKKKRLGSIQEFLHISDSSKLPEDLKRARYSVAGGFLEESLHEDVLHFKKRVRLDLEQLGSRKTFPWGLREIVRYRFDRLTPSMEDAYKDTHMISPLGQPTTQKIHRVYHVFVAAWVRHRANHSSAADHPSQGAFKAFQITLDKFGVVSCDALKWHKDFGIPTPPGNP